MKNTKQLITIIAESIVYLMEAQDKVPDSEIEKGLRTIQMLWRTERPWKLHTMN